MFKEWGTFVTRHPYAVLSVWLIVLLLSVPLALTFSDRLTYSMDSFIPKDLESIRAQDIYNVQFPDAAQSQIIIAIKGDPATAMAFVDELNRTVYNGSVKNLSSTTSVYDIQRSTLANVSPDLHTGLHDLYENATDASKELYEATDDIRDASRDLYYLRDNVTEINSQLSTAWGQAAASSDMMYGLRSQIIATHAGLYYVKSSNPGMTDDQVIDYFKTTQGLDDSELPRLYAIYGLTATPSDAAIDELTMSFVTAGMSGGDAAQARALYARGNDRNAIWQFVLDNALAGQDNGTVIDTIRDAWSLGRSMTNETVDEYVLAKAGSGMNESERQKLADIYAWGKNPGASVVSNYVIGEAGKDLNESERELIVEVFGLGRSPSADSLRTYTVNKVNKDLDLAGNLSYLYALLDLDRNASKSDVEAFARGWAETHDFSNPQILPTAVVQEMSKGNLTLFIIGLKDNEESQAATDAVVTVRDEVKSLLSQEQFTGIEAYVTGSVAMSLDAKTTSLSDMDNIDKISVVMILVLLCLYFRSFVAPIVPLAAVGAGIVVCFGGLCLLAGVVPLFYLIMTLCVVIMLGAGTDYCVFTLSRYVEERALGRDVKSSVITAVEHAGKSVASSGITAMIGFSALLLVDQGIFGGIGIGIAFGIMVSLLVALSLLPAVLTIAGDRLFWPRKVYNTGTTGVVRNFWSRITRKVIRHSKLILVLALLTCIPAVYFTLQLQLGADYVANMAPGVESKMGFDAINDAFGSGSVDKVMVLMTLPQDARDSSGNISAPVLDQVESVSAMLSGVPGRG